MLELNRCTFDGAKGSTRCSASALHGLRVGVTLMGPLVRKTSGVGKGDNHQIRCIRIRHVREVEGAAAGSCSGMRAPLVYDRCPLNAGPLRCRVTAYTAVLERTPKCGNGLPEWGHRRSIGWFT